MRRKLAAGNWKMNGNRDSLSELNDIRNAISSDGDTDVIICPPASLLFQASEEAHGSSLEIGAQDCHEATSGAFTGDVSADMIAETGARSVIVGHSERRDGYSESNEAVRAKAEAAIASGLTAIICIGESEDQRVSGETLDVLKTQLLGSCPDTATGDTVVIAYEPIWAIGTGRVPTLEQIAEVHDVLRDNLVERFGDEGNAIRLLYGGSVKPGNAADIFTCQNVDGALVGGASLKAADFVPILQALQKS